jgi:hypothetical protein
MKVRAVRGVCIGVERHLKPGDTADLNPAEVTFLVSIGAVAPVLDEPLPPSEEQATAAPELAPNLKPTEKPGKARAKEK